MARIERDRDIKSSLINKKFLQRLIRIIKNHNASSIQSKIEIILYAEGEKTIYNNLNDVFETAIGLDDLKSFSLRVSPLNKRDRYKSLQLYFRIANKKGRNYYQLIGYNEGNLLACEKQIKKLLDEHKNWYSFLFKFSEQNNIIPLVTSFSLSFLTYSLLMKVPMKLSADTNWLISFFLFFVYVVYFGKIQEYFFPLMDIRFNETHRSKFWRSIIGIITLALIANFIWFIINYILK